MQQAGGMIQKLQAAMPAVREWIESYLAEHEAEARPVGTAEFPRLADYYPADFLDSARFVDTPFVGFPPLSRLGLSEFAALEDMQAEGITFLETFFVRRRDASLFFHELVHVVQWQRLGMERFLIAYGIGLIQHGYRDCPLEEMAYRFQASFEQATPIPNLVSHIEEETDAIWEKIAPRMDGL